LNVPFDVLIVGAGPAGSVAATVLARKGVRVRIVDRAAFPRPKLCGDTLNPGTLAALRALELAAPIERAALRVDGMRLTGPGGVVVEGRYPDGLYGLALTRGALDWALLQQAIAVGAEFEPGTTVRRALIDSSAGSASVHGVVARAGGRDHELRAPVIVAADGRRSALAFGLGLARHPARPRRWAVGAYYEQAGAPASFGEMHIRGGRYIGVAPVPGGLANVCLVKPSAAADPALRHPASLLAAEIAGDPYLCDRFGAAAPVQPPVVLGPLAVDAAPVALPGLILAGDAAGFVDPMTGDGLRFAVRGGALAAGAALEALDRGWTGVHARLAAARRREFAPKWRFNRALRAVVASSTAVRAATAGARVIPVALQRLVVIAGDCSIRA
jgi:geranylgeranyl reductase family protein